MLTEEQFTAYAQRYLDTVFRVAFHYLKSASDAEDVAQDVFLKLMEADMDFQSDEHVRRWLIRVAVNQCRNMTRRRWWRQENIDDYAQKLVFEDPKHSDLFYAVMALPKRYRLPIYLYYYEEYTTAEIGEILRIPKNTVCTQLKRGREWLKNALEEDDYV